MANLSGSQTCSICSSPVRAEIEAALDKKEPLRAISARSAFSRASLSRHNRKCRGRQIIAEHKLLGQYDPYTHRVFLLWPNAEPQLWQDVQPVRGWSNRPPLKPEQIIDVLFVVEYAKPLGDRPKSQSVAGERLVYIEPKQTPDTPPQ